MNKKQIGKTIHEYGFHFRAKLDVTLHPPDTSSQVVINDLKGQNFELHQKIESVEGQLSKLIDLVSEMQRNQKPSNQTPEVMATE